MKTVERSLQQLRREGFLAASVERRNPHVGGPWGITQDLFGLVDVLALREGLALGVQACQNTDFAKHVTKALANPKLPKLLASPLVFEIWAWRKASTARVTWTVRRHRAELEPEGRVVFLEQAEVQTRAHPTRPPAGSRKAPMRGTPMRPLPLLEQEEKF